MWYSSQDFTFRTNTLHYPNSNFAIYMDMRKFKSGGKWISNYLLWEGGEPESRLKNSKKGW